VIVEGDPPGDEREEAAGEPETAAKIGVRPRYEAEVNMMGFFSISFYFCSRSPP
jgi:hypothetical protein